MGVIGSFLRADYSVQCFYGEYKLFIVIALINMGLYLFGIPVFFYFLIKSRFQPWALVPSLPLHLNFTSDWAYYEVFELARKTLLISVVGFVYPDSSLQCLYLLTIDLMALLVLMICRPYAADPDDFFSGVLILIECSLFFLAFLIKADLYTLDYYSKDNIFNASFTMVLFAFFFFLPLNIAQKLPSTQVYLSKIMGAFTAAVSLTGFDLSFFRGLDARSRYAKEMEETDEALNEIRASLSGADVSKIMLGSVGDPHNSEAVAKAFRRASFRSGGLPPYLQQTVDDPAEFMNPLSASMSSMQGSSKRNSIS